MADHVLSNIYQYDDLLIRSHDFYATAKYDLILESLKELKIKSVLNAGCGSGELSFLIAAGGFSVTGFDMDKDYINLAKRNLKKLKISNCTFDVSSIEEYKSNIKYDVVISTDVLEHIEDDKTALSKLVSFLKPGGSLFITVPAGQYLFGYHDKKLGHFRRYSKKSFLEIIPPELKIKKIRYFGFILIPFAFLISKVIKIKYPMEIFNNKRNIPLVSSLAKLVLEVEKNNAFPVGTSLFFWGIKS